MKNFKNSLLVSLYIVLFWCHAASADVANSSVNQKEQDKARQDTLSPNEQVYSSSRQSASAEEIVFPIEKNCRVIERVTIKSDNDKLTSKLLGKITHQALNKCLGINGIRLLSHKLQNELIVQGYITSLIDVPSQSLDSGDLLLTLTYGRVGEITFSPETRNTTSLWNTMPLERGDILRLSDLEQGIANLQRLPGTQAQMQLAPGEQFAESSITLTRNLDKKWQIGAWLDDAGSRRSGRYQGGGALYLYDITGLNDLFYVSAGGDMEFNQSEDGNSNASLYYSIPFGYWTLSVYAGQSEYRQLFKGSWITTDYTSKNRYYSTSLSRVLSHTREQKTTLMGKIFKNRSRYYLAGSELMVMRKQNPAWELTLNHQRYYNGKVVDASLGIQRRLPWLSSSPTPEEEAQLYTKQSRVVHANVQALMKFAATGNKFTYAPQFTAQFSPDTLSSDNKINIGNRWTVRGFDGETTLSGNQGWYWRNDFIWDLPLPDQQFYVGTDIGKIIGDSEYYDEKIMSGAVLGVKGEKFQTNYNLFIATPIVKPGNLHSEALNLGMSFNWRF
ncbi:Hemolysin transporter protein ShlB precursor [compost metagenome]